jgi:Fe-S-cluster-containing dehydrogenase component
MTGWNLIIDVAKCENCHNCTLATKDEHVGNNFAGYAAPQPLHGHEWIRIQRRVRGDGPMVDAAYLPTMCNHCDNAPCIKAGGSDGTVRKRDDGIIIIDPEKAKGRRDLVESCPYGAIWWNEELHLPQIWIFDAHLLDQGWKEPRCAQTCPTGSIVH